MKNLTNPNQPPHPVIVGGTGPHVCLTFSNVAAAQAFREDCFVILDDAKRFRAQPLRIPSPEAINAWIDVADYLLDSALGRSRQPGVMEAPALKFPSTRAMESWIEIADRMLLNALAKRRGTDVRS